MSAENYSYIGIFCFISAAVISLLPMPRLRGLSYLVSSAGALSLMAAGIYISFGNPVAFSIPISRFFEFSFTGDGLSAFFMVVISVLVVASAVFSIGYTRHMKRRGLLGFLFNLFALSMYAVTLAGNIITFLISWEAMSVVSYFLVTFDRTGKSEKAGLVYAVMTHMGTAFIIALFLILYKFTGSMDFSGMAKGSLPENIKAVIFIFSLIGFGAKAGIIPLHVWLPKAHPAAPSNISALMSGVMIKTGIYGFLRVNMGIINGWPEWCGIAVILLGAASAILGVLYALMEHDLKRLLAYHSVENIGIILLGIGASMVFKTHGLHALSALALGAGLYHTLNHAIFKGLLFLGAGSVLHATGTRNMEEMGGLIKTMPYTGFFFLIGSASICALPPFNGFVSEWLTYQALLLGFQSPSLVSKIISPLGGAALALTGALAAACFVKAFGISFLGMPRGNKPPAFKEDFSMTAGMAILAVLCLLLGIFPSLAFKIISPSLFLLTGTHGVLPPKDFVYVDQTGGSISPLNILLMIAVMSLAAFIFILAVGGRRKTVYGGSWDCGIPQLTSRMQYTATAFTKPLRIIFKRIYFPTRELKVSYIVKPFFVKSIQYSGEITPFFEKYLYTPLTGFIHRTAEMVRFLQSGSLHLYLGYMLITLVMLLIFWS